MTKGYSIFYTHFNEDKTYVHYCSDGYCRLGSIESGTYKRFIPKWVDDKGNEYEHEGELPYKERLKIIENFVKNKSYLNDYWMRWLEKSKILYEKDKFLQDFYNCTNYYDEYEFDKMISNFENSTKVSDKIQEIANRLKEKKMNNEYQILYTEYKDDFNSFIQYCDDGYCRKGTLTKGPCPDEKTYLPKFGEYNHAGEMTLLEKTNMRFNSLMFSNQRLYDYWMIWLDKSEDLYYRENHTWTNDKPLNFGKILDKTNIDLKKHLCLKLDNGQVIRVESVDPITGNIVFEPYIPSEHESKITGTGMDYKKEFEDLLEEFDLLETNYDNLKEMYDELKEKDYLDSLLIIEYESEIETLKSDYAKLKQEYLNKSNTCFSLLKEVRRLNEVNADLIEQDLGTEYD